MKAQGLLSFSTLRFFAVGLLLASCGSGEFEIKRTEADPSLIDLRGEKDSITPDSEAKTFYINQIYPLVTPDGSNWEADPSIKGCTGSGCHSLNSASQKFFQQDPSGEETSWNYARTRRKVILFGDFAPEPPSSARTLKNRNQAANQTRLPMASRHQSFRNWDETELDLIDDWTALP